MTKHLRGIALAIAAGTLSGALALAGAAQAQTAAPQTKPVPQAQSAPKAAPSAPTTQASRDMTTSERIEARIVELHKVLAITPDQEPKWRAVADQMRKNASAIEQASAKRREAFEKMNAIEDLQSYQELSEAHAEGMKQLVMVFTPLYQAMAPNQKQAADSAFHRYNRRAATGDAPVNPAAKAKN
jgi:hypothetical protein